MSELGLIRRLWEHCEWADDALYSALTSSRDVPADVWREYAHILGAETEWLARLEQRKNAWSVWPDADLNTVSRMREHVTRGFGGYLAALQDDSLSSEVSYVNTAGKSFTTAIGDILTHVMLHGQYHRGKINLLLREGESEPVPVDYIAFVRGAAAAVTPR